MVKQNQAINESDLPIAVIDAETDPFKHGRIPKPFLWGFYDGTTYEEYSDTNELAERVAGFEGIVYAHNGGKFDFHFLLEKFERCKPIMLINGRIVKANIGKAQIRDSYALLPAPLSAYKKDDIDYKIFEARERGKPQNKLLISQYLKTDCVYLYDLIKAFIDQHGLALTQAGASMVKWEEISGEKAPQSSKGFFEEFSQFYFGGRVEVFKAGSIPGPHKLYDIRSAYPRAMLEPHPYKLNYTVLNKPSLDKLDDNSFIIVRCISNGALPYRENHKIYFPNDDEVREFHCIGHEFFNGLSLGLIRNFTILKAYNFLLKRDFKDYIQPLYMTRLEAIEKIDLIEAGKLDDNLDHWLRVKLFTKLLMNSLYGKFGSNPDNYGHYLLAPDQYVLDDFPGYEQYAQLGEIDALTKPLDDAEKRFYNVATAASITSWVRAYLLKSITTSKDVLYCDTDSILCADFSGPLGKELGDWQHEEDVVESWIAGKKMYALKTSKNKWKTASKGVRLEASDIKKMCSGETIFFKPEAPTFSLKKDAVFTQRSVKMLDAIKAKV